MKKLFLPGYIISAFVLFFLALPASKIHFDTGAYRWLYLFALSFLIALVATPLFRWLAKHFQVLDMPEQRKIHRAPTPLLGGAAVYTAVAVTVVYNFHFSAPLKGIALGGTLIMLAGMIDDCRGISATIRLIAQVLAVGIACFYGLTLTFLPDTAWYFNFFEILVTFIWIIGITNSLNFLDGMDGLATGLAAIASFYISLVAIQSNQNFVMFLAVSLCGSCLGFLPYNFIPRRPASVFLGDAGSNFLGYMLGSITVMTGWATHDPVKAYSMPALILGILIFDMTYITISRFAEGKVTNLQEWVAYVGQDHLHHRLRNLGLSAKQTVCFLYFLAFALGISAIVLKNGRTLDSLLLVSQAFMIFFILIILMRIGRKGSEDFKYQLRSAVTSLLGFTDLVLEKGGERLKEKTKEEFLKIIESEGKTIKKLLADLSDISQRLSRENTARGKKEREDRRKIFGKVLVADDNEHIRRLTEISIRKKFNVILAENGAECLAKARSERPDVVILDICMPEMNGMEAAREIKKDAALKDTRLIFQTAKNLNPREVKEALLYADRLLAKPFAPGELLSAVMEVFQAGKTERKSGASHLRGEAS